jgi:broad specificity phosphatase PhoE
MSTLVMVRHAQASFSAPNYDQLSEFGRTQARLLGEYWLRRGTDFDEVYCGPRERQRQTAQIVEAVFGNAGRPWPDVVDVAEFDEYDLNGMLRAMVPELSRRDPAFAELLAAFRRDERSMRGFQRVFEALTMHWATTTDTTDGVESFAAFRDRIERGLRTITQTRATGRRVALFTSGGVIGAAVRLALDAPDRTALEVNWRVRNCSLTEFVFTQGRFNIDSFNNMPHLEDSAHWTFW